MKTNIPHVLTLGAAWLLAPLTSTLAQSTWETTDALAPYAGRAIVADASGNFISLALSTNVVTSTGANGPVYTAVSLSPDTGLTWQTVGSIPGYALKLTAAPDGTLYAAGNRSATVSGKAFVWYSLDQGTTWTVSDPWPGQTNLFLETDVAAGNSGAVYLLGAPGPIVRKGTLSPAGGITWTTADSTTLGGGYSIAVRPGPAAQPDQIFITCNGTVRRSLDAGATWANLAPMTLTGYSVAIGANGALYVDGPGSTNIITATNVTTTIVHNRKVVTTNYTTVTLNGWLVQKSIDGGASWTSVDFAPNAQPAHARSLVVDAFGRVFAVGYLTTTPNTWFVRGSTDGSAPWVTTDTFLPTGYTSAVPWGIASDVLGNVCVIGDAENGTPSADLAPIRRLAAP